MSRGLAFLLTTLVCITASAQQNDLFYRLELGGGLGAGFNLTDVSNDIGLAASAIARFPLNPRMAVKTQFTYFPMKGSTKTTAFYPATTLNATDQQLDYKVNDAIYDLSALFELHFLPYGYEKNYQGNFRITPYIQAGLGLAYGPAGESFTINIPLGIGLKYKIAPRLNLGLDWTFHLSLSDKLDGLDAPVGIESTEFRNKDHYTAIQLTLTYDLCPKCPTCNKDDD